MAHATPPDAATPSSVTVTLQSLRAFAQACMERVGVPPDAATIVADNLVEANLRGTESHGVARLGVYMERVAGGLLAPAVQGKVLRERAAMALLDGENGLGAVIGAIAMGLAVQKARQSGTAFVAVRNSNHFGAASYFLARPICEHMIGFALSNSAPLMAVWGGRTRAVGTNPIAIGIPARHEQPILLDMATSMVSRGHLFIASRKGEPIPEGWALDPEGNPTRDAASALKGTLLPVGGPKGSGLALAIEILCGVLAGGLVMGELGELHTSKTPQGVSHLFGAIDIGAFEDPERFLDRVDHLIAAVRNLPRMVGVDRIYLPGERGSLTKDERLRTGVPLPRGLFDELQSLAKKYRVDQWLECLGATVVP